MRPDFAKTGGLVPVVAQDAVTGEVLMVAWMDAEAFDATLATGQMHYHSRSRGKLWRKGEESGNVQKVVSLSLDCDADTLLAVVEQTGPACHTGARTCFFTPLAGEGRAPILAALEATIEARRRDAKPGSHTARLLGDENLRLKKLGEEASELIMAAKDGDKPRVASEAADLVYHALVAAAAAGVPAREVLAVLHARHSPK